MARGAAVAMVGGLLAAPAAFADTAPVYYALPSANHTTAGSGIVTDPAGNVWFASDNNTVGSGNPPKPPIGKLVPSQAHEGTTDGETFYSTPNVHPTPCCANRITSVAFDNDKNQIWFAGNEGTFGYGDPATMTTDGSAGFHTARLSPAIAINGLAINQSTHEVWFAENGSSNSTATGNGGMGFAGLRLAKTSEGLGVSELPNIAQQHGEPALDPLRYDAEPRGVSIGPDGTVWFAESDPGNPGWRIAKVSGGSGYQEFSLPCNAASPCSGSYTGTGVTETAVAPSGDVWYTNELNHSIGVLSGSSFTEFKLGTIDPTLAIGTPSQLRFAADGTLWVSVRGDYSHPAANAIVRIVPNGSTPTASVFKTGEYQPLAIATSVTGDVWFTANGSTTSVIGQLKVGGGSIGPGVITPTPGPGGTPTPTPTPTITLHGVPRPPGTPQVSNTDASVNQICVGPPQDRCSLVYLIQTHEYVRGFPGSGARLSAKPKKSKTQPTIGSATAILNGGETRTVSVPLTAKAQKALKKLGHIKATLTVSQVIDAAGTTKVIQTKQITFKYKKPKKGKAGH